MLWLEKTYKQFFRVFISRHFPCHLLSQLINGPRVRGSSANTASTEGRITGGLLDRQPDNISTGRLTAMMLGRIQ